MFKQLDFSRIKYFCRFGAIPYSLWDKQVRFEDSTISVRYLEAKILTIKTKFWTTYFILTCHKETAQGLYQGGRGYAEPCHDQKGLYGCQGKVSDFNYFWR